MVRSRPAQLAPSQPYSHATACCAPARSAEPFRRRYILVYPQGCDVCDHLSLFLCVADYDKLLPGAAAA